MAYIDKFGVEYSDDKKTLVRCPSELTGFYEIMEGVSCIGMMAFNENHLQSVKIPKSVRTISSAAFIASHSLSEVIIPYGVISIENDAFNGCDNLQYVYIPSSVTEIGERVFTFCPRLKTIDVEAYNENYSSIGGILFNKKKTKLILCPPKCISTTYVVPPYVQEIESGAFGACDKLKTIKLPPSLTSIGKHVFVDCMSLNSIIVPKGEIQRFAAMEELNFYCGILTEDDNQNLANINTTMMKNFFYGALSFLCITLAICAIVMTCRSKAVVTVKASTGSEEIIVNVNSSSVDKAIENAKEIKTTWNEKELGNHYHRY